MGRDNARKGSSTTPVGPKSGRDAPGNIGGGVKPSTARVNDRLDNNRMQQGIRAAAKPPASTPKGGGGVSQGFIKNQTQSLRDQYSQYRSPPGFAAPKAPTAGRGITDPRMRASTEPSTGKVSPTVQAGTSWTNPAGVPEAVKRALAERGFAPDGTRLPTQATAPPRAAQPGRTISGPPGTYADVNLPSSPTLRGLMDAVTGLPGRAIGALQGAFGNMPRQGTMTQNVPGLSYQGEAYAGPIGGMQPTSPTVQQVIARDPIDYGGPRAGTTMPGAFADPPTSDNLAGLERVGQLATTGGLLSGNTPPSAKIADRIAPSVPARAPGIGYGFPSFNPASPLQTGAIDRGLAESVTEGMIQSLNPRPAAPARAAAPPRPTPRPAYPGADGVTGADIGGVFDNGNTAAPAAAQNAYKVQRGDTLARIAAKNGTTVKAIAEANGIRNVNKIREGMTINIPTDASIEPMSATGDEIDRIAAMMQRDYAYAPPRDPALADGWMWGGFAPEIPRGPLTPPPAMIDAPRAEQEGEPAPLSGEGDGGMVSDNFMQDDGQPKSVRELVNRYRYERDAAKQGFRDLPGRIGRAIREGDFRAFQPRGDQGQGSQNWERTQNQPGMPAQQQPSDLNTIIAQLLALLEQQQSGILSGPSQADLVNNTFR